MQWLANMIWNALSKRGGRSFILSFIVGWISLFSSSFSVSATGTSYGKIKTVLRVMGSGLES